MVTKRQPQAIEEGSPRRSFNSIEFYSGVQLISLRSPLKSSLSSVAYCFTLRVPGRTYIRTFLFHIRTRTSNRPEGERARGSVAGHRQRNSSGYLNEMPFLNREHYPVHKTRFARTTNLFAQSKFYNVLCSSLSSVDNVSSW